MKIRTQECWFACKQYCAAVLVCVHMAPPCSDAVVHRWAYVSVVMGASIAELAPSALWYAVDAFKQSCAAALRGDTHMCGLPSANAELPPLCVRVRH